MRYVYLVKAGKDQYKIGVSGDVRKRIASLQTSNINLVELVCAKRIADESLAERSLHKKMREFSGNGGKEWFHLSAEQAIEVAIEISNLPSVEIADVITNELKSKISQIIRVYESKIVEEQKLLTEERKRLTEEQEALVSGKKVVSDSGQILRVDRNALRLQGDEKDYREAKRLVIDYQQASASFLQRRMRVGYAKAARLIEKMEEDGIVSPLDGIRREVL
jgi:hypothetical protein